MIPTALKRFMAALVLTLGIPAAASAEFTRIDLAVRGMD